MTTYYYEYRQPRNHSYDPENPDPTNPNNYKRIQSGTVDAQDDIIADQVIMSEVGNIHTQYLNYDYGIIMYKEDDGTEFTDSDWKKRLERELSCI
jgi:hypothetical protein